MSHTPGPWNAIPWTTHAATTVVVNDQGAFSGKRIVAECETEEDARLIASAPDLLEALEKLVEYPGGGNTVERHRANIEQARAAISRATGEQS